MHNVGSIQNESSGENLPKSLSVYFKMFKASYIYAYIIAFIKYGYIKDRCLAEVKDAGEKGEGLFATQDIQKGVLVFIAPGPTRHARFEGDECYLYPDWYSVEEDIWIDIKMPYVKINHSCRPSTGIDGSRLFVSLKEIKKGEEITFDYSISDDEEDWKMDCLCGESNCRKIIGGIQFVKKEHYNLSHPFIPEYFQKKHSESQTK